MKCPVCEETLVISSREGIEIDHCAQCRGVWLDRGELDKIIERAAPAVAGAGLAPPPRARGEREYEDRPRERGYDRDYDDDRGYRKRKKRSFLEDIFDFD